MDMDTFLFQALRGLVLRLCSDIPETSNHLVPEGGREKEKEKLSQLSINTARHTQAWDWQKPASNS